MPEQTHEDEVVRREIALEADRETVWALVSDADQLATWLADEVWLDAVEPGAEGIVRTDGELREVVVDEVVEQRRIALRWSALPDGPERLVELTLDDLDGGGTRFVVVEVTLETVRAIGPAFAGTLGGGATPQMLALA
jgi:uncharacterized protein YndB with AHSA1/START domain